MDAKLDSDRGPRRHHAVLLLLLVDERAKQKRDAGEHGHHEPVAPTPLHLAIGFVTNFFDTLGIGSYATTTAMFRVWKLVPDEQIPGTLNVGHVLPTVIQAIIYMTAVRRRRLPDDGAADRARRARAPGSAPASSPGSAAAQRADRHGRRPCCWCRDHHARCSSSTWCPAAAPRWRSAGAKLVLGVGVQLRARRADDAWHRPLCAVHDPHQPARDEPVGGVSRS